MNGPKRPVSPVSNSVDALRRQFGLGRLSTYETLREIWPELVGPAAADQSELVELRNGVVRVEAFDPAVAEVITWSRQRLIDAMKRRCPGETITDLSVRVRRRPQR